MKISSWCGTMVLALAGCGGGGDSTSNPGAKLTYEMQASIANIDAASFVSMVNAEGAKGFRFIDDISFMLDFGSNKTLYAKSADTSYNYEILTLQGTADAFAAGANAQGARGFQFAGSYPQGVLYRKDSKSVATFNYRSLPAQEPFQGAAFLAQANAQGMDGYRWVARQAFVDGQNVKSYVSLYEKSPASNASYSYEALKVPETVALFEAQLRAQAARGFRLDIPAINKGVADEEYNVYVKDIAQAATFDIRLLDFASTSTEGLAQANVQGIEGYAWQGRYQVPRNPKGGLNDLYVRSNNCSGALCGVQSSMGYY